MKSTQSLWTRDQLILAIELYCRTPYNKIVEKNPDFVALGKLIGRTTGAVSFKLSNFASLDPEVAKAGKKGHSNAGKLSEDIWEEFYNNWDMLPEECERVLSEYKQPSVVRNEVLEAFTSDAEIAQMQGKEKERLVKVRVNQQYFRKMVLTAYNNKCCITGMSQLELLVASHIKRWSDDEANRMNPHNGLALNPLHDKAFELGLITITPNLIVCVSSKLAQLNDEATKYHIMKYDGQLITSPKRFVPSKDFLQHHNDVRFVA